MRAVVHHNRIDLFPTDEEVKRLCKPGEDANTCIFLVMGTEGWECMGHNQRPMRGFIERARQGDTHARREGCHEVLEWAPAEGVLGEVAFQP